VGGESDLRYGVVPYPRDSAGSGSELYWKLQEDMVEEFIGLGATAVFDSAPAI
jgi:hypothetical protein